MSLTWSVAIFVAAVIYVALTSSRCRLGHRWTRWTSFMERSVTTDYYSPIAPGTHRETIRDEAWQSRSCFRCNFEQRRRVA